MKCLMGGELIRMLTKMTHDTKSCKNLGFGIALCFVGIHDCNKKAPFYLVFCKEALLPIEVEIPTIKMMFELDGENVDAFQKRLSHL